MMVRVFLILHALMIQRLRSRKRPPILHTPLRHHDPLGARPDRPRDGRIFSAWASELQTTVSHLRTVARDRVFTHTPRAFSTYSGVAFS